MNKLKVFVSSKMDDLEHERKAAKEAIEEIFLTPIMFEDFDPTRKKLKNIYLKMLEKSDIYLGIFGKNDSKPVRTEFERAEVENKEIKIFIKKVGKRDDRLNKFIGELEKKNILYTTFNNTEDLKEKIKNSLISTLSECYQDSRDILSYTKEK